MFYLGSSFNLKNKKNFLEKKIFTPWDLEKFCISRARDPKCRIFLSRGVKNFFLPKIFSCFWDGKRTPNGAFSFEEAPPDSPPAPRNLSPKSTPNAGGWAHMVRWGAGALQAEGERCAGPPSAALADPAQCAHPPAQLLPQRTQAPLNSQGALGGVRWGGGSAALGGPAHCAGPRAHYPSAVQAPGCLVFCALGAWALRSAPFWDPRRSAGHPPSAVRWPPRRSALGGGRTFLTESEVFPHEPPSHAMWCCTSLMATEEAHILWASRVSIAAEIEKCCARPPGAPGHHPFTS